MIRFPFWRNDPSIVKEMSYFVLLYTDVGRGNLSQVMLTKNINVQRNLVNGARGVVKSFDPVKGKLCFFVGHPKP